MREFLLFLPAPDAESPDKTKIAPSSASAREDFPLSAMEPERDDFVEPLLPLVPAVASDVEWWCGPRWERRDGDYLRAGERPMVVG